MCVAMGSKECLKIISHTHGNITMIKTNGLPLECVSFYSFMAKEF